MDKALIAAIHLAALQAEHGTDLDDRVRGYSEMSLLLKPKVVKEMIEHMNMLDQQLAVMYEREAGASV